MTNFFVMGPCSVENEENYISSLERLKPLMEGRDWYFKASFDKANRTSLHGGRGPGLEDSIKLFEQVKKLHPNIRLTTDIHEPWQAEKLAGVIDVVQIPAFLCRQTDLIVAAAQNFNVVNIKKGQWLGPNNLVISVDKVRETNSNAEVWLTDRGTMHGYHRLVVDIDIVDRLKKYYDKVVIDCTHSTQRSRDVYGVQGRREVAERFFVSAPVFHYDGIFAETHPKPEESVSDGDCQIRMDRISGLLNRFDAVKSAMKGWKDENLC